MVIPADLKLGEFIFHTIWAFMALGLLYFLFIVWYEAKRDGFSTEKILDITFSTLGLDYLLWVLIDRLYVRTQVYFYTSPVLLLDKYLLSIFLILSINLIIWRVLTTKWHWSLYRILDIFSLGVSYFLQILSVGYLLTGGTKLLFVTLIYLYVLHNYFFRYRGYKIASGISFSLLLLSLTLMGFVVYRPTGYLLLYSAFITISLVNLYFRRKAAMPTKSFPKDFLDFVSEKLRTKEKRLRDEERVLTEEDPYLQSGRAEGNAESMDEAILEDMPKEISDVKKKGIAAMRAQVKKALFYIKLGKYGTCEICGKPIDKARLEIFPEATRCLSCSQRS